MHEVLLHWWQQRARYRVGRGANRHTFMRRVVTNRLRDLRRRERAAKRRGDRAAISLDQPINPEASALAERVEDPSPDARPDLQAEASERRDEIDQTLARLTPRQQRITRGLTEGHSLRELRRSLRISRGALSGELQTIRAIFEASLVTSMMARTTTHGVGEPPVHAVPPGNGGVQ